MIIASINEIIQAFEGLSLEDKKYTTELLTKTTLEAKRKVFEKGTIIASEEAKILRAEGNLEIYNNVTDLMQALNAD